MSRLRYKWCTFGLITFAFLVVVVYQKEKSKVPIDGARESRNAVYCQASGTTRLRMNRGKVHHDRALQLPLNNKDGMQLKPHPATLLLPTVYGDDRELMEHLGPIDSIPRIFHFMWKNRSLPNLAAGNLREWARLHPDWTFVFWTDDDLVSLVRLVLANSGLRRLYDRFPKPIMRSDFSRYLILYTFGGIYADIDVLPLQRLDPVLRQHSCIVAREPEAYTVSTTQRSAILASNFFMASRRGHPFWPHLMRTVRSRSGIILLWTGPLAVTDALRTYRDDCPLSARDAAVFMAPSLYFDPPPSYKGDALHLGMIRDLRCPVLLRRKDATPYWRHVCAVARKENRIDWTVSYRFPRHYNASLTRHLMFNTYGRAFKIGVPVSVDSLGLRLVPPMKLVRQLAVNADPYKIDEQVVANRL